MDSRKRVPQHKVGVRILNGSQMGNIFPAYQSMVNKIEEYRQGIWGVSLAQKQEEYQDYLMYDNIFGIFGQRGSGKSSTVFTIRDNIIKEKPGDYALPIIMPDLIVMKEGVLGWLLAMLGDAIKDLASKAGIKEEDHNAAFGICKVNYERCALQKLEKLYASLCEKSFSRKYNPERSGDYFDSISDFVRQSKDEYHVSRLFVEFWNAFVEVLQELNKDNGQMPLIYVIFDDVDLAPERVEEMISTIMRYLSHPNVITIVTADEDELIRVLQKIYRDKMDSSTNAYLLMENHHIANNAKAYFDKLLPPSNRYYLELFDSVEKKGMFIEKNSDSLVALAEENIIRLIQGACGSTAVSEQNFLQYQGRFLKFYLKIFGITARQITNGYFTIEEAVNNLIHLMKKNSPNVAAEEKIQVEVYHIILRFMRNMINSNPDMAFTNNPAEIEKVCNNLFLRHYNGWPLYINYQYLLQWFTYELERQDKELQNNLFDPLDYGEQAFLLSKDELYRSRLIEIKKRLIRTVLCGFALCFFAENMLAVLDESGIALVKDRSGIHGNKELTEFANMITNGGIRLFCEWEDVAQMLYIYEDVLEYPENMLHFNMMEYQDVYRYLHAVHADGMLAKDNNKTMSAKQMSTKEIFAMALADRIWFKNIVQMVFMYYGKYYLLNRGMLSNVRIQNLAVLRCRSMIRIENALKENMEDIIREGEILYFAQKAMTAWNAFNGSENPADLSKIKETIKNWNERGVLLSDLADKVAKMLEYDDDKALKAVLHFLKITEKEKPEAWATSARIQEICDLIQQEIVVIEEKLVVCHVYDVKKAQENLSELKDISPEADSLSGDIAKALKTEQEALSVKAVASICTKIQQFLQKSGQKDYEETSAVLRYAPGQRTYHNAYIDFIDNLDYYIWTDMTENAIRLVLLAEALVILQKYYIYARILEKNDRLRENKEAENDFHYVLYQNLDGILYSNKIRRSANEKVLKRMIFPVLDEMKESYIDYLQL